MRYRTATTMPRSTAIAEVINTVYPRQTTTEDPLAEVVRSVNAHPTGPTSLICATVPPAEEPGRHAVVAKEALKAARRWLAGSPYAVPDNARITQLATRIFKLSW